MSVSSPEWRAWRAGFCDFLEQNPPPGVTDDARGVVRGFVLLVEHVTPDTAYFHHLTGESGGDMLATWTEIGMLDCALRDAGARWEAVTDS